MHLLFEGDARLVNTYAVLHPQSDAAASRLATWLVGVEGRERIRDFTIGGRPMFKVPGSNH